MSKPQQSSERSPSGPLEIASGVSTIFTVVPGLIVLARLGLIDNIATLVAVWLLLALLIAITVWRFTRWVLTWRIAASVALLVAASVVVVPTISLLTPKSELDGNDLAGPATSLTNTNDDQSAETAPPSPTTSDEKQIIFAYEDGTNATVVDGDDINGYRIEGAKQPSLAGNNLVYLDEQRRQISLTQASDGETVRSRILENRVSSPSVSKGTPLVVFIQEVQAAWQINIWNPSSDEVEQVYSSKIEILSAKVSPSGQMILWQERTSKGHKILVSDIQQIQPRELYEGNITDPAWSIDDRQIAFSGKKGAGYAIHTLSVDGSEAPVQRTVPDSATDRHPSWAPDAGKISFVRTTPEDSDLWTVDLATGQETQRSLAGVQSYPSYGHLGD